MKRSGWIFAFLFLFGPVASAALCGNFPAHEEYLKLSARGMRMSSDPALVVVTMLNTDMRTAVSGAWNLGVLAVASAEFRPPIALKFSDAEYHNYDAKRRLKGRIKQYVAVHRTLGYLRVAPQLRAVLEADEVRRLLQNPQVYGALYGRHGPGLENELKTQWLGYAMDLLNAPHPLSRSLTPPPYMAGWCEEHIARALREMAEIRKRVMAAGVDLNDQQLVTDPDAHVHLMDMDPYVFNPPAAAQTDFTSEAVYLIEAWERLTGQTLGAETRAALLADLRAAHPVCTHSFTADTGEWRDSKPILCAERQEAPQTAAATVRSKNQEPSPSVERAIAVWPQLQQQYLSRGFWEKVTWLTVLSGAAVAGRKLVFAKLALAYAILAPTALNAQEMPGYFATPEGIDWLLHYSSREQAESAIRANSELAERILQLSESSGRR